MSLSLSKVKSDIAEVDVAVAGEVLHFSYHPTRITPQEQEELMDEQSKPGLEILSAFIAKVGASWDLVDDSGGPLPLDYEFLRSDIPFVLQDRVVKAVMEDMYPNQKSGGSLGGT